MSAAPLPERAAYRDLNRPGHARDEREEDGNAAGRHGGEHNRDVSAAKAEERHFQQL
jgi:hypothetical protein